MTRLIAYYRVSTAGQGCSGHGLDAQREVVARHVAGAGGRILAEFSHPSRCWRRPTKPASRT